jgi:hypothetical protein
MKRNLLILLVITALMMITCGNEPPSDFYNGTPEDSVAIITELNAHADFLNTYDLCNATKCSVTIGAATFVGGDSFYRADSPIVKQHITMMSDTVSVLDRFQDLWYAKDTTCTVYLFDTFTIISQYDWDTRITGHYNYELIDTTYDSTIAYIDTTQVPWDTIWDYDTTYASAGWTIGTIDTNSTGGTDEIETTVYAEGLRHLFLEPLREMAIEDGDTTYPLVDPREWILKRISYGNYYFPNEGADYPLIDWVTLGHADGRVDTIQDAVTDTLFTGHAMNRLKHIDSLMHFTAGETLDVAIVLGSITIDSTVSLFFVSCGGERSKVIDGHGKYVVPSTSSSTGIMNLVFEVILKDSYYYLVPAKDYLANAWLVPVIIQ